MVGAKRHIRITDQGGISLPEDLLLRHHLKAGDEVVIEDTDRGVLITPEIREQPMGMQDNALLFARPSRAEIARRQALFAQVMTRRKERSIAPLTSVDLIHLARTEESGTDAPGA